MEIEVLPYDANVRYLGCQLTFDKPMETEINNRISAAWKIFMSLCAELMTKKYSIKNRIRLLNSTITSTILYAAATWALTRELEMKIVRTQRRILQMILGHGRGYTQGTCVEFDGRAGDTKND